MTLLEYIETHPGVFLAVVVVIGLFNAAAFFLGGRKAEERFRNQSHQHVLFRERGASGHSKRSLATKLGGASKVLEVVVTERELWLKGIWPMFSFIGSKHDLTHRVPKSNIRNIEAKNRAVEIWFKNETGSESHVELNLKDVAGFTSAIRT